MSQILVGKGEQAVHLLAKYGNRHGLVAGATGTGKSVSLLLVPVSVSAASVVTLFKRWPVNLKPSTTCAPT